MPPPSSMMRAEPLPLLPTEDQVLRVSDLIADSIRTTARYRSLADSHNALVDFVEKAMRDQQSRLQAAQ